MMAVLQLAWTYRKYVASILLVIAIYVVYGIWHSHVFESGRLAERIQWQAAAAKQREAYDTAMEARRQEAIATASHNEKVLHDYNAQLLAIAGDRDSLARRVHAYEARLASAAGAVPEAGSPAGAITAAPQSSGTGGLDEAFDAYDAACRADAAQLEALQRVIVREVEKSPAKTGE